jgi:hypothetical protein
MRKTIYLTFSLLLFISISLKAQKKMFSGISVGAAIPVGDFGSKDVSNEKAGLAQVGLSADINYGYRLSKNFGLLTIFRGRINGVDEQALRNSFQLPTGSGGNISIKTTNYTMGAILVGVYESIPLSKAEDFFFEIKGLAGLQGAKTPKTQISGFIPGIGNFDQTQDRVHSNSFAYQFGLAVQHKLSSKIGLRLGADYNASNPNFKIANATGGTQSYKQPTNTIDIVLGIVL